MDQVLTAWVFPYVIVFARIGSALMVMPPFSSHEVSARIRLIFALAVTVLFVPLLEPLLPSVPAGAMAMMLALGGEAFIGLFLGTIVRLLVTALSSAGQMMAFLSGMANALVFDPIARQQSSLLGRFFGLTGILLILVTDLHHLLIQAIVDSYSFFTPGSLPPVGDFTEVVARTAAQSFYLAFQLAAPFVVVSLTFYLGMGFMVRLVPNIQIFFVALPMQVMNGLIILMVTVTSLMMIFLNRFEDGVIQYLTPQ